MDIKTRDLQYKMLYCLLVSGKTSKFADTVLKKLFKNKPIDLLPFDYLKIEYASKNLDALLRSCKSGNYSKLNKAIPALFSIDLENCSTSDLEKIHGIGPKTSRFFILWTRPTYRCAVLDTHILKWLRSIGHEAPKSTPSNKKYIEFEKIFLDECDKLNVLPSVLDKIIWEEYSKSGYIQNNIVSRIEDNINDSTAKIHKT